MLSLSVSLLAAIASVSSVYGDVTISPNTALFLDSSVVGVSSGTVLTQMLPTTPVGWALRDIGRDFYKTIGTLLVPISALPSPSAPSVIDTVLHLSVDPSLGAERFTMSVVEGSAYNTLVLTGGNELGLIYGLYQFSGDVLGVHGFWWFLDVQPEFVGSVSLPSNFTYDSGLPAFTSRGAFFNDEDVSGYFFTDPAGDSVYEGSSAAYYCETLLRLRANTIIPSTFAYVDERPYRVAAARGLFLGNHHVMPLGNNVYAWPKGVPYSYRENPEPFHFLWNALTEYQQLSQNRSMVYTLGYRGINDEPFWNQDPECNTVQCQGGVITAAIANQSIIAKNQAAAAGQPEPIFVAYLWMELLALFEAGTLTFPNGTATVFTDFPGSFNILGSINATAGDGFYAHIQMMSGTAAQLSEFIPLHRMFANIWEFWVRNATRYGMINVSDLKSVPINAEAVYRYMWSPAAFNSTTTEDNAARSKKGKRKGRGRGPVGYWPSHIAGIGGAGVSPYYSEAVAASPSMLGVTPQEAEDAFLLAWADRHYSSCGNATLPASVADLWSAYFQIPYMSIDTACTSVPTCNLGDHFLGSNFRNQLGPFQSAVSKNNQSANLAPYASELASFAAANGPSVAAVFTGALALQPSVCAGVPSTIFAGHSLMQAALHYFHLEAYATAAEAMYAYMAGDSVHAIANVSASLDSMDAMLSYLRAGESGVWSGVYSADAWTWTTGTRAIVAELLATLKGLTPIPAPGNPYPDYNFMTYECAHPNPPAGCTTFPFATFNASVAWDILVRASCSGDVPTTSVFPIPPAPVASPNCASSFTGASFTGSSTQVGLFISPNVARPTATIQLHYTLDGSAPTPASPIYTDFVSITANTTIRAQAFDAAVALGVPILAQVVKN